jgi:hypothetical protein
VPRLRPRSVRGFAPVGAFAMDPITKYTAPSARTCPPVHPPLEPQDGVLLTVIAISAVGAFLWTLVLLLGGAR